MILVLPLTDEAAAKIQAKARAEGTTLEQVVRKAITPILASTAEETPALNKPI